MQKFNIGDIVYIKTVNTGVIKTHITERYAIVIGTYNELYGGNDERDNKKYNLRINDSENNHIITCAWYDEIELQLVKKGIYEKLRSM